MAWDPHMLALGVVEEFAAAQMIRTRERLDIELGRIAVLADRRREYNRERMRILRGGLKGPATYNDWRRGTRPATRYVQLELPFPERINMRERLPADRTGVTQKFTIIMKTPEGEGVREIDIYLTTNAYPDSRLGEVFIHIGKAGHTEAIYDEWAKATSRALQHGVPVDDLFRQHVGTRFDPQGATTNVEFPRCTSVLDLVARWILSRYGSPEARHWITSMQRNGGQP